jgi:hypothetical protein
MTKKIKVSKRFDREYYKAIKRFTDHDLRHRPWCGDWDIIAHIQMVIGLMPDLIEQEDFEAAQAVKDSVIEFVNSFSDDKIDKNVLLKIPAYKGQKDIRCHISFVDPKTKL